MYKRLYEPVDEILVLITYECSLSFNMHAQLSSGSRGLNFGQRFHLCTYFVFASSKGSDETAHLCRLVRVFAAPICDKYQNHMNKLKCVIAQFIFICHIFTQISEIGHSTLYAREIFIIPSSVYQYLLHNCAKWIIESL